MAQNGSYTNVSDRMPERSEFEEHVRAHIERLLVEKGCTAIVIHGMGKEGGVFTAASGPPMELLEAEEIGFEQLLKMIRQGAEASERNG